MQINSKTLPNGLQIIHNEDKTTQMVAVNTLYMVGSRNEEPEHTGFAHLSSISCSEARSIYLTTTSNASKLRERTMPSPMLISPIITS